MLIDKLIKVDSIKEFFNIADENNIPQGAELLLSAMEEVKFSDGEDILTLGATSEDGMYIILDGAVDVLNDKEKIINTLGEGAFVGELGLINDDKRAATVRANGEVVCANISRDLFEKIASENRKIYGSFMNMLYAKTTKLVEERERIKSELAVATKIQSDCLEDDFTRFNSIEDISITARMVPAKEVGGDFYDVFMVDDTHMCFLIADVSGKGVPGAMFMSMAKIYIKSFAVTGLGVAEIAAKANDQLCYNNKSNMFVTAFICILDLETNEVKYVNAGHNKPFIFDSQKKFTMVDSKVNLVLGMMEGIKYKEQSFTLNKGEAIYLYTDGVTEAVNPEFELFGDPRLEEKLNEHVDVMADVDSFVDSLYTDVNTFADGAEQADDITMVYLCR